MKHVKRLVQFVVLPLVVLASIVAAGLSPSTPKAHAACPPVAGYQTFGYEAGRSSFNPVECSISPLIVPPFLWSQAYSQPLTLGEGISTLGTQGFIGMNNLMMSFSLATGVPNWIFPTGGPIVGAATADLGNIYFGSQDGNFYGLNLAGAPICIIPLGAPISTTPDFLGSLLVVSADNGVIFGINGSTCSIVWSTPALGLAITSPAISTITGLVYDSVRVSSSQSVVFGVSASTGAIVGVSPAFPATFTVPVLTPKQIVVGSNNPAASLISFALNPPFSLLWTSGGAFGPVLGKPAADGSQVYAVSAGSGTLFAVSVVSGVPIWGGPLSPCGPLYKADSPTVANGGVFVGAQNCIAAFRTVGGPTWALGIPANPAISPLTIVNGAIYVAMLNNIFAF